MNSMNFAAEIRNAVSRTGNIDKGKTLRAWQDRAINSRKAVQAANALFEAEKANVFKTYAREIANEKYTELKRAYTDAVSAERQRVMDDLAEVVKAKRDAYAKACGNITDNDVRLLTVLKMRTDLKETDIVEAANAMSDSLAALRTLRSIAREKGINFVLEFDGDSFAEDIESVEKLANTVMRDFDGAESGYVSTVFWEYPDEPGPVSALFAPLDNSNYTNPAPRKMVDSNKIHLSEYLRPETNATRITLTGEEALGDLMMQFHVSRQDLETANPGKDLSALGAGDTLIVPSNKMRLVTDAPGFASTDSIEPIWWEPPADANG